MFTDEVYIMKTQIFILMLGSMTLPCQAHNIKSKECTDWSGATTLFSVHEVKILSFHDPSFVNILTEFEVKCHNQIRYLS